MQLQFQALSESVTSVISKCVRGVLAAGWSPEPAHPAAQGDMQASLVAMSAVHLLPQCCAASQCAVCAAYEVSTQYISSVTVVPSLTSLSCAIHM